MRISLELTWKIERAKDFGSQNSSCYKIAKPLPETTGGLSCARVEER